MVTIIWEYHIEPTMQPAFEQYYHANGTWAQCFQRHPDFIETRLIQDSTNKYRYLTIDYWQNETSFVRFYRQYQAEYDAIDAICSAFTINETRIGIFVEPAVP
jgi:hypothetical protein